MPDGIDALTACLARAVATKQLPFFGAAGRPLLETALSDSDPEIVRQARYLLDADD